MPDDAEDPRSCPDCIARVIIAQADTAEVHRLVGAVTAETRRRKALDADLAIAVAQLLHVATHHMPDPAAAREAVLQIAAGYAAGHGAASPTHHPATGTRH